LDVVDKLLDDTIMTNVDAYMTKKIAAGKNNGCTLENAGVRREWYIYKPNNPAAPLLGF
jgi:tyrosinase